MDYRTKRPLLFLIYPANTDGRGIFAEILEELKKRGFLRKGTIMLADKGFCSYRNYDIALKKYIMNKIHRFTRRSADKFVYANVLLLGILIRVGYKEKEDLQRLAEW